VTKHDPEIKAAKLTGLALLREPFPARQISKLPKPTAAQTKAVKDDFKTGIRCKLCGAWHHKEVVHLDYVGHAALTDRLLDCDPHWNWEPLGLNPNGMPIIDGGLWIKLTVCNVTRLGFGNADGKSGGDAIKELIGDALRNAAMRFGAALDLWHKGDLHGDDEPETDPRELFEADVSQAIRGIQRENDLDGLAAMFGDLYRRNRPVADDPRVVKAKDARKADLAPKAIADHRNADLDQDEITY
jgi:hypothetical protein